MDFTDEWWRHIQTARHPPLSRDVGFPGRYKVGSKNSYIKALDSNEGQKNCYTSVYSDYQLKEGVIDRIYVDMDRTEEYNRLQDLRKEMMQFVAQMEEKYDANPRVYFSGNGFQMHLDIEPVRMVYEGEDFEEMVAKPIIRNFIFSEFNSPTVDTSGLGVLNVTSRVPFTRNVKNSTPGRRYCIPVETDDSVHEILHKSKRPERMDKSIQIERNGEISKVLSAMVDKYEPPERNVSYSINIEENQKELNKIRKIVEGKPTMKSAFDGRHRLLHYMVVPRLLEMGQSEDEIHKFCREIIEETGVSYSQYRSYVKHSIQRTLEGDKNGNMWRPWSWRTFLVKNPDLLPYYKNALNGEK